MLLRSRKPLIWQVVDWGLKKDGMISNGRARRMQAMLDLVRPPRKARVIDLGGTEQLWKLVDHHFHVTMVNITDQHTHLQGLDASKYSFVKADACDLTNVYGDGEFDLVFSNSCIEHVGDADRQAMFAREARRIGKSYWVQTPSTRCPIEAHTLVPMYWQLPTVVRNGLHRRWQRKHPRLWELIESTRVLSRDRMKELFSDGEIFAERKLGIEKSYAVYKPYVRS